MKKSGGGMKANVSKAHNHAINKGADDGRTLPKNLGKRQSSGGEKTYGYGGKNRR